MLHVIQTAATTRCGAEADTGHNANSPQVIVLLINRYLRRLIYAWIIMNTCYNIILTTAFWSNESNFKGLLLKVQCVGVSATKTCNG